MVYVYVIIHEYFKITDAEYELLMLTVKYYTL